MITQPKLLLFILLLSCIAFSCEQANSQAQAVVETTEATMETSEKAEKVLRHVVVFKYKDEATEEDVNKVTEAFKALPNEIPEIIDFEWGTNNSPENLNDEFTHCYLLTFASEEDRDVYLPHPAHKAFGDVLKPYLDKVFVIDYWTNP